MLLTFPILPLQASYSLTIYIIVIRKKNVQIGLTITLDHNFFSLITSLSLNTNLSFVHLVSLAIRQNLVLKQNAVDKCVFNNWAVQDLRNAPKERRGGRGWRVWPVIVRNLWSQFYSQFPISLLSLLYVLFPT